MRTLRTWLTLVATIAVAMIAVTATAAAQTTTGAISGRVTDSQGLPLPGVTVNVSSPSLQGIRTVVTSDTGDYIVPQLPSGTYNITFELSGFEKVSKTTAVAPTQSVPVNATLGVASLTEVINVTGQTADVLTQTTQV